MKMWMLVTATALTAGTAHAQFSGQLYGTAATGTQSETQPGYPSWDQARIGHYRHTLEDVHREALTLQAADGGRLTPEHIGYLQAKIDAAGKTLSYVLGRRSAVAEPHLPEAPR